MDLRLIAKCNVIARGSWDDGILQMTTLTLRRHRPDFASRNLRGMEVVFDHGGLYYLVSHICGFIACCSSFIKPIGLGGLGALVVMNVATGASVLLRLHHHGRIQ